MGSSVARRSVVALVAAVSLISVAIIGSAGAVPSAAKAVLKDASGATIGNVRLTPAPDGKVLVAVSVGGLAPGFHGFHIHTIGTCTAPDFTSAGGHFNPAGAVHAGHAGDQPVLLVNADGTAVAKFVTDRYAIGDLFDADGSALVVHAAADNYANIPTRLSATGADATTLATGDAGSRVACGLIQA